MLDQIKQSERHLNPCHKILLSSMWETWTLTKYAKYYVKNSLPQIPFSFQGCFWNKAVLDKICSSLGRSNSFTCALENPLVHSTVPVYHSIQTPSQNLFSFFPKETHTVLTSGYQIFSFICWKRNISSLSPMCLYPGLPSKWHISEQHTDSSYASFTPSVCKL